MLAARIDNLVKTFKGQDGPVYALAGVNLDVVEGEMMMLVGPSGCGKTTLISIVAGILSFDSGTCEVFGKRFETMSSREKLDFRAKNIGFIFQSFNLLPSLTISENVAVPLIISGVERKEAVEKAGELLSIVGLGKRLRDKPNSLSGGQQQRVAIARALVHSPRLVVCDEPTSALDHETGTKIMELLKELNNKLNTTFIIVTHDNRIFQYSSHIAYMDDGKILRMESAA